MAQTLSEYQAIAATVQHYIDGAKAGRSNLMKPAFHDIATLTGYVDGGLNNGAIQILFDWVDQNGAATTLEAEIVSVDITGTEKDVPRGRTYIDLSNKPDWFRSSPVWRNILVDLTCTSIRNF